MDHRTRRPHPSPYFEGTRNALLVNGQITRVPAKPESRALRTVLCAEGYVAPPRGDEHTLGASFDLHNRFQGVTPEEHIGNLNRLREIAPELATRLDAGQLDPASLQGRAAYRCTSPDYLPLVGPLADAAAFANCYAVLARDARQVPDIPCPWLDGLYVNLAHGSRGVVTAPLCGELLAAWLEADRGAADVVVMRAIKRALDPDVILNPGVLFAG